MSCGRLPRRLEMADKQQQRNCGQGQPRNDTEAIHERQKTHLMLQLLVQIAVGGGCCVRTRESFRHEIVCQLIDPAGELLGCRADRRAEIGLMELMPAFRRSGNEGDPKASSPIAEKVRETGGSVVLFRPQLRIGKDVDGYKEEAIPEPLIRPGQSIMRVIGRQSEGAVVPHGRAYGRNTDHEQYARRYDLALDQLRCDGGEECDHERARAQYESCVRCSIPIERLKDLWNECRASEEPESKYKEKRTCDGKVAICEQTELNDGLFRP